MTEKTSLRNSLSFDVFIEASIRKQSSIISWLEAQDAVAPPEDVN